MTPEEEIADLKKRLNVVENSLRLALRPEHRAALDDSRRDVLIAESDDFAQGLGFTSYTDMRVFMNNLRSDRNAEQTRLQALVTEARARGISIY